jgi:outer membrane protein TolC
MIHGLLFASAMTLRDAVSYALDHSPTVAAKVSALAQSDHALAVARGNAFPVPSLQLQNQLSKNSNYGGAYAIIGAQQSNVFSQNTAQLGASYNLQTGGVSFLQLTEARATDAQARYDLTNTEDQIATNVTNAYYAVVGKAAIVDVDAADLTYQDELVKAAKVKEKAGVAAGVDVLRAQVGQAKSASTLVGARADVENARELLAQTIGSSLDQTFAYATDIASPPMPTPDVVALERIALDSRPDLKAADESLIAAQTTRSGWLRELFPTVQINAAFGNQYAPTSFSGTEIIPVTDPTTGAPIIDPITNKPVTRTIIIPRGSPGFWAVSASSSFTFPLIDYNQRHSLRVQYDSQVRAAELMLDQAKTQVSIDVRQSYRAAQTALAQLDYTKRESELGIESSKIAQVQYQSGLIALSDVIQAQNQAISAQADLINARVTYVNAVVKLRISLGTYDARSAVADLGK